MAVFDDAKMLEFQELGDERGHLVVVEEMQNIPFNIKRIFYIYGSDGDVVRGQHANKRSEFVLINICGSSKVRIKDGLGREKVFNLDKPHMGIYIPRMLWKDMYDFSSDSILLCLASEHYDSTEYVRDYSEYERLIKSGKMG